MPNPAPGRREITLLQERSTGTFARVHLARATDSGGLSRIVAVKVLKERWTDTADVLDRTRDEAMLLASLQHQNIVRVEAITEIDGLPAIIMEFVHGIDLSQLIGALAQRNTGPPPRAIFEIAEHIASALAAAWFKVPIGKTEPLRVVHRDIKPSNVMISVEGELRVLDFGTARFEDAGRIAKTEAFRFGSLKYMSPERRDGARGEHPADLYSLGLVIIELFGGRIDQPLPIAPQQHDAAVIALIDAIPSFGLPNAGWDNSLRETLTRLCATDPDTRLDARQTVKLMRAFKQQSNGDGLVAFAEEVVAPITHDINAIPEVEKAEEARATRFALESDGRTSVLRRGAEPQPDSLIADDLPTQIAAASLTIPGPKTLAPEDDPTQPDTRHHDQAATLRPGFAMAGSPADLKQSDDASSWNPAVKGKPRPVGPRPTPGVAQRLPPPRPADSPSGKKYLGIGCAIASIMLLIMAGIAGVSWVLFLNKRDAPDKSTAPTSQPSAPEEAAQTMIDISLHGGDSTVQWIRLINDQDERLLTARPDQTGSVPAGTYTVSVKVVARSALSGTLKLNEPTDLTCKPTTMGRIRCVNAQGKTQLLLQP